MHSTIYEISDHPIPAKMSPKPGYVNLIHQNNSVSKAAVAASIRYFEIRGFFHESTVVNELKYWLASQYRQASAFPPLVFSV